MLHLPAQAATAAAVCWQSVTVFLVLLQLLMLRLRCEACTLSSDHLERKGLELGGAARDLGGAEHAAVLTYFLTD